MCFIINTGFSQSKKIGFDSLWAFSYPDFLNVSEAIDSNMLIASTYEQRRDMVFVFNEDSLSVKTYVNDSLIESSYICEIIHGKKQVTYKTHVKYNGTMYHGYFTIFYKGLFNRKLDLITGGFSEPDITNGFVCFKPHYIRR